MKVERLAEHILDAAKLPLDRIRFACEHCGLWKDVPRQDYDPPTAVVALTSGCPRCNADLGGFGSVDYFDQNSDHIGLEDEHGA